MEKFDKATFDVARTPHARGIPRFSEWRMHRLADRHDGVALAAKRAELRKPLCLLNYIRSAYWLEAFTRREDSMMQPAFHHQQLSPNALFRAFEPRRSTLCRRPIGLLAALIGAVSTLCAAAEPPASGPLAEYVARDDNSYAWRVRREGRLGSVSYAELILTSQTWKDTTWKHQLFVMRPSEIRDPSRCMLLVDGGSWNDELAGPVGKADENLPPLWQLLATFSSSLQTPIAVLRHVPRAPIFGALEGRTAISHSFERFINTGDPDWLMLLPMVKSVVRAMDAVHQFGKENWSIDIQRFTVTGASQRGWTTWLTAAIDS
ncbi:MAG: PhoPQ-activated protein PqaA family protein, partial [Pirellulales bacterium]